MAKVYIGISGWSYAPWRGDFYPAGLAQRDELPYAARRMDSIEINGTFYRLQNAASWAVWRAATPADFVFAVKGSRFITHNLKLKNARLALANFLASGMLQLDRKLGPVLWQLADTLRVNEERLDGFLAMLPKDFAAASAIAREHDHRVAEPVLEYATNRRMRHTLEIRHESWFTPEVVRIARRHGVPLVFSSAATWPYTEELTGGFVYMRLHGSREIYTSRYSDAELDRLAERIGAWTAGDEPADAERITERVPPRRQGRDVYVYFDNDRKVHAPRDALRLKARLARLGLQ